MAKHTEAKGDQAILGAIEKIVVNAGIGRLSSQPNFTEKILPELIREFAIVTGQKPRTNPAKKSIAGFKLREGTVVGLTSTLRGRRMVEFFRHLNMVVFPRIRDFRGVRIASVDTRGNLTVGIKEHTVFPEINPETSKVAFGIEATIVPKRVKSREDIITFYRGVGIPFERK